MVGFAALARTILVLLTTAMARAQVFEAASLKPSVDGAGNRVEGGPGTADPLRYTYTFATLEGLIVVAWDLDYYQVQSKAAIDRDHL